ncbi:outer membrane protein [Brucella sp. IR073]|uniref:outer membrane protein n=1 Tax=unclassified Brucella TaxID=2632610 RepID=UPI003B97F905
MKAVLLASVAALFATSAMAADAIVSEPTPPAAAVDTFSWTGGYIGLNAGYAGGKFKHPVTLTDELLGETLLSDSIDFDADGFVGGVQAGYNYQLGNGIVLGAEADFQGSTLKGDESELLGTTLKGETKVEWFGTVRARLGYTPVERLLVYATGGLAYGKIKSSLSDGTDSISDSETKTGWTVGAGAEYALDNHWTVKGEYLYTDLGKRTLVDFTTADLYNLNVKNDVTFHTIRVGVNYKF